MKGKVFFVGAGPGDPGLLTVKSVDLIKSVDVVIYDSLVTKEILDLIPSEVLTIAVRQAPRSKGLTLQEMCGIMIDHAISGEKVVRLKSGDPLIFGRTWEEIEFLNREEIEYEIIPGVTSALASAAFAGIPLTDRRFSSSFAVVTGHEAKNKLTGSVNWGELAKSVDTLIVLMGVSTITDYCGKLLDAGVEPYARVTIVSNASRNTQKIFKTTIGEIVEGVSERYGTLCTVIINIRTPSLHIAEEPLEPVPEEMH